VIAALIVATRHRTGSSPGLVEAVLIGCARKLAGLPT